MLRLSACQREESRTSHGKTFRLGIKVPELVGGTKEKCPIKVKFTSVSRKKRTINNLLNSKFSQSIGRNHRCPCIN